MFWFGKAARRRRLIRRHPLDAESWRSTLDAVPMLAVLDADERARLHDLAVVFLHETEIEGCRGLAVDDAMRLTIAAQACLPILELGHDAYANVSTILLYPEGFRTRHHHEDHLGIVTEGGEDLLGEAWSDGPVVLNWEDVRRHGDEADPFNLVVHEFAHQIDMLDGYEDGVPPLGPGLDRGAWERDFRAAREDLVRRERRGEDTFVDPYAGEDEAEGFAVFTETFFCSPRGLIGEYPEVYAHLRAFFRQDPAARSRHAKSAMTGA